MRNIYLKLMYKGTNYMGWQNQRNSKSIQEKMEEAIYLVTNEKSIITASGRTDAGTHALGQVANFKTNSKIEASNIKFALNTHLPYDIRVIESKDIDINFHARHDAIEKTYIYLIDNSPIKNPLLLDYAMNVNQKLDVENMKENSKYLIGEKDFTSFYKMEKDDPKKTIRTIDNIDVASIGHNLIKIEVTAKSFLYNMVRIIVGTLIEISLGKNKLTIDEILAKKDRRYAGFTSQANGLYLKEVKY